METGVKVRSRSGSRLDFLDKSQRLRPSSHSTVGLSVLQLSGQDLVGGQESHAHMEEDLPGVPQPVQVCIAQADDGQQQHHLQRPGRTIEQVQVTLKRESDTYSEQPQPQTAARTHS